MKITKSQLKKLIKEELQAVLEEAGQVQIQRARVAGRVRPGSAYDVVTVLDKGTTVEVLEVNKSWIKVRAEGKMVWIPKNALIKTKERKFQAMRPELAPSIKSSPAGLVAGSKG